MKEPSVGTEDSKTEVKPKHLCIKLGIDWHARHLSVARIIDNGAPEPTQKFSPEKFLAWVKKQQALAETVVSCYEAGPGGFVLHRQLTALGVTNHVVVPKKMDPYSRRVVNDKSDARELAQELDRFCKGNDKALRRVYVPTPEQEAAREPARQRKQLQETRLRLATQGRTLLLAQGWHESNNWWKEARWRELQKELPDWIEAALKIFRTTILAVEEQIRTLIAQITARTPKVRPKGMGALTFEEITREVGDFQRFKNRKAPGSYVGLTGGVSDSGESHRELSITKAGHKRLRTILVELSWRFAVYQPQSRTMKKWAGVLLDKSASSRVRKRAIVAAARQIFVDIWRWQIGRATPEQLGWIMNATEETPSAAEKSEALEEVAA